MLTESEKQFLLQEARHAIEGEVRDDRERRPPACPPSLMALCGAFVTLREDNQLRGCIGYIEGVKPLIETIREAAVKAALEDPRFMPVTPEELPNLEIEISVLSPMEPVYNVEQIEIGKHGLLLEVGSRRGLLLPQVPMEYGWDRMTFLEQTARKAGLPEHAWADRSAKIHSFTAEIFSEHHHTISG